MTEHKPPKVPLSKQSSKTLREAIEEQGGPSREILDYYRFMCEEDLESLEVEEEDFKLKIRRHVIREHGKIHHGSAPGSPKEMKGQPASESSAKSLGDTINTPLMGIFYRSPSPNSEAFVQEGKVVEKNATVCIVEAMKVMNEIRADRRCKILQILVENGKQVTPKQPLFVVQYL